MRILLFLFLLLVLAAAASPYYIGSRIENEIRDQVAVYNNLPGYSVKVIRYNRGYRDSEVIFSIGLDESVTGSLQDEASDSSAAALDALLSGLRFPVDIQHGPVLDMHGLGLGLADFVWRFDQHHYPKQADVFEAAGLKTLITTTARLGFSGEGWLDTVIPDIDATYSEDDTDVRFTLSGYDDDVVFSHFGKVTDAAMRLDDMSVDVDDGASTFQIDLDGIMLFSDADTSESILVGTNDTELAIEVITLESDGPTGRQFAEIESARAQASVTAGERLETLNIRQSLRVQEAIFDEYELSNVDIAFSLLDISKSLYKAYHDSTELFLSPASSLSVIEAFSNKIKPELQSALQYSPRFELQRIAWSSNEGDLDLSGSAEFNSAVPPSTLDFDNPISLIPALEIELQASASRSMIETIMEQQARSSLPASIEEGAPSEAELSAQVSQQIDFMMAPLVEQGFVTRVDQLYSSSFNLSEGTMIINGAPIPLPFFLQN